MALTVAGATTSSLGQVAEPIAMIVNIAVPIIAVVLVFRVVRSLWMVSQAKQAIRADLARRKLAPLDIRRVHVWRDCGSISASFWMLVLDYQVSCKDVDGQEARIWYSIDFAPLIGRFRSLELHTGNDMDAEDATKVNDHG